MKHNSINSATPADCGKCIDPAGCTDGVCYRAWCAADERRSLGRPALPGDAELLGTDGVAPAQAPSCDWSEEDPFGAMPGTYASACGELWSFTDGGPKENSVRFCHGCGKPVNVIQFPEPTDEADVGVTGAPAPKANLCGYCGQDVIPGSECRTSASASACAMYEQHAATHKIEDAADVQEVKRG